MVFTCLTWRERGSDPRKPFLCVFLTGTPSYCCLVMVVSHRLLLVCYRGVWGGCKKGRYLGRYLDSISFSVLVSSCLISTSFYSSCIVLKVGQYHYWIVYNECTA